MKFDINKYTLRYVMHCRTRVAARKFLAHLDSIGLKWSNGTSYLENDEYDSYLEDTCYNPTTGKFSSVETYRNFCGYTILEFDDFDWENEEVQFEVSKEDDEKISDFLSCFAIS